MWGRAFFIFYLVFGSAYDIISARAERRDAQEYRGASVGDFAFELTEIQRGMTDT